MLRVMLILLLGGFVQASSTGDYYLFVKTDSGLAVAESSEANNASSAHAIPITRDTPDLQVTSVTAPASLASGQPIAVTWSVKDFGDGRTNLDFWNDDVYLSADSTIGSGDILFGTVQHSGTLNPNQSYTRTASFSTDVQLTGAYFVIVRTDSTNLIIEGGFENNNDRAAAGSNGGGGIVARVTAALSSTLLPSPISIC